MVNKFNHKTRNSVIYCVCVTTFSINTPIFTTENVTIPTTIHLRLDGDICYLLFANN